jgi:enoyl-CoA hydratase/carnithine racemase
MFTPKDAVIAGFLDHAVPAAEIDGVLTAALAAMRDINSGMHEIAKRNLRGASMALMREFIDADLTIEWYRAEAEKLAGVSLPPLPRS